MVSAYFADEWVVAIGPAALDNVGNGARRPAGLRPADSAVPGVDQQIAVPVVAPDDRQVAGRHWTQACPILRLVDVERIGKQTLGIGNDLLAALLIDRALIAGDFGNGRGAYPIAQPGEGHL